jgi:DNA-binding transcriptional regulator YiaG
MSFQYPSRLALAKLHQRCNTSPMDAIDICIKDAISAPQVRAARALLGWSQDQLTAASGASKRTLAGFESGETTPRAATVTLLRAALESAGVEFIAENGGGPGVRLKKPSGL